MALRDWPKATVCEIRSWFVSEPTIKIPAPAAFLTSEFIKTYPNRFNTALKPSIKPHWSQYSLQLLIDFPRGSYAFSSHQILPKSSRIAPIGKKKEILVKLMYSDLGFQGNWLTPNSLRERASWKKVPDSQRFGRATHADFILELIYQ